MARSAQMRGPGPLPPTLRQRKPQLVAWACRAPALSLSPPRRSLQGPHQPLRSLPNVVRRECRRQLLSVTAPPHLTLHLKQSEHQVARITRLHQMQASRPLLSHAPTPLSRGACPCRRSERIHSPQVFGAVRHQSRRAGLLAVKIRVPATPCACSRLPLAATRKRSITRLERPPPSPPPLWRQRPSALKGACTGVVAAATFQVSCTAS